MRLTLLPMDKGSGRSLLAVATRFMGFGRI
jgi:hypothetical protein